MVQNTKHESLRQIVRRGDAWIKSLESGAARPPRTVPPTISQSEDKSAFASLASVDPISAAEIQGVWKLLSISNPAQFMDKLISHLLIDTNVHLHEILPRHLAPSSESTFVIEENRLQFSASIKWFHSPQDVLLAV